MGTAAGTPPRPLGAWHEAVPYTTPAELAVRLAPRVAAATAAGDPVVAILDDTAGAELRAALGPAAAGVDFQDPGEVHTVPDFTVALRWARTSRRVARPGGRALVLGQQVDGLAGCAPGHWARLHIGLDVAIEGLPITVLCPVPVDSPALPTVLATHPVLATTDGWRHSADYRDPAVAVIDFPPPPPPDLGPPTARFAFGPTDLTRLRRLVGAVADAAGLAPEHVADLVLAVNELATNSVEHGAGTGRLSMWAGDAIVAEVADRSRMSVPFAGMRLPPTGGARGRGLWLASELCDVLQVWSDDEGTIIRVRIGC